MVDLRVFTTVDSLRDRLGEEREESKVSFVATMGALHHGHVELVKQAAELAETVVVSIFVNPTQFNKKEDLVNYPRTLSNDLEKLESIDNVVVFAPSVSEVYPEGYTNVELDLGILEEVMEGEFRPGHFKGVMNVVKRFFDIIEPDFALFGEKDIQQLAVIRFMVDQLNIPVEVVGCETIREPSGLASSSRNYRLSQEELVEAEIIIQTMNYAKSLAGKHSVSEVEDMAKAFFSKGSLKLEYFDIVHPQTLERLTEWVPGARLCTAAYCAGVRLIDNCELIASSKV